MKSRNMMMVALWIAAVCVLSASGVLAIEEKRDDSSSSSAPPKPRTPAPELLLQFREVLHPGETVEGAVQRLRKYFGLPEDVSVDDVLRRLDAEKQREGRFEKRLNTIAMEMQQKRKQAKLAADQVLSNVLQELLRQANVRSDTAVVHSPPVEAQQPKAMDNAASPQATSQQTAEDAGIHDVDLDSDGPVKGTAAATLHRALSATDRPPIAVAPSVWPGDTTDAPPTDPAVPESDDPTDAAVATAEPFDLATMEQQHHDPTLRVHITNVKINIDGVEVELNQLLQQGGTVDGVPMNGFSQFFPGGSLGRGHTMPQSDRSRVPVVTRSPGIADIETQPAIDASPPEASDALRPTEADELRRTAPTLTMSTPSNDTPPTPLQEEVISVEDATAAVYESRAQYRALKIQTEARVLKKTLMKIAKEHQHQNPPRPEVVKALCRWYCELPSSHAEAVVGGRLNEVDALLPLGLPVETSSTDGTRRVIHAEDVAFFFLRSAYVTHCRGDEVSDAARLISMPTVVSCPSRANALLLHSSFLSSGIAVNKTNRILSLLLLRRAAAVAREDVEQLGASVARRRVALTTLSTAAARLAVRWERGIDVAPSCSAALATRVEAIAALRQSRLLNEADTDDHWDVTFSIAASAFRVPRLLAWRRHWPLADRHYWLEVADGLRADEETLQAIRAYATEGAHVPPALSARPPWCGLNPAAEDSVSKDSDSLMKVASEQLSPSDVEWLSLKGNRDTTLHRTGHLAGFANVLMGHIAQYEGKTLPQSPSPAAHFARALQRASYEALCGLGMYHLHQFVQGGDPLLPADIRAAAPGGKQRALNLALTYYRAALTFRRDQAHRQLVARGHASDASRVPLSAAEALYGIGISLLNGASTTPELSKSHRQALAAKYINASAFAGHPRAIAVLSKLYSRGVMSSSRQQQAVPSPAAPWWAVVFGAVPRHPRNATRRHSLDPRYPAGETTLDVAHTSPYFGWSDIAKQLATVADDTGWDLTLPNHLGTWHSHQDQPSANDWRGHRKTLQGERNVALDDLVRVLRTSDDGDTALAHMTTIDGCHGTLHESRNALAKFRTSRESLLPLYLADLAFTGRAKPQALSNTLLQMKTLRSGRGVLHGERPHVGHGDFVFRASRRARRNASATDDPVTMAYNASQELVGDRSLNEDTSGAQAARRARAWTTHRDLCDPETAYRIRASRWELVLHKTPWSTVRATCELPREIISDETGPIDASAIAVMASRIVGDGGDDPAIACNAMSLYGDATPPTVPVPDTAFASAVQAFVTEFEGLGSFHSLTNAISLLREAEAYYSTQDNKGDSAAASSWWLLEALRSLVFTSPPRYGETNTTMSGEVTNKLFLRLSLLRLHTAPGSRGVVTRAQLDGVTSADELMEFACHDDVMRFGDAYRSGPVDGADTMRKAFLHPTVLLALGEWYENHAQPVSALAAYMDCGVAPNGPLRNPACLFGASRLLLKSNDTAVVKKALLLLVNTASRYGNHVALTTPAVHYLLEKARERMHEAHVREARVGVLPSQASKFEEHAAHVVTDFVASVEPHLQAALAQSFNLQAVAALQLRMPARDYDGLYGKPGRMLVAAAAYAQLALANLTFTWKHAASLLKSTHKVNELLMQPYRSRRHYAPLEKPWFAQVAGQQGLGKRMHFIAYRRGGEAPAPPTTASKAKNGNEWNWNLEWLLEGV